MLPFFFKLRHESAADFCDSHLVSVKMALEREFFECDVSYIFGELCRIIDFYVGNEYIFIAPMRFGENESNKELFGSYVEKAIIILYCFLATTIKDLGFVYYFFPANSSL